MNQVILSGRLTADPRVTHGESSAIARFSLAVDRRFHRDGQPTADFINCVSFGKAAEFAEKYYRKGIKLIVSGRIQTGSYTNKDGQKVYTTDVVIESSEFAESKSASQQSEKPQEQPQQSQAGNTNFMDIPDGLDGELPFK